VLAAQHADHRLHRRWRHGQVDQGSRIVAEAVVRLAWRGVTPINLPAPVKYLSAEEGGVSHFRYGRDNVLLTWMHTRLMIEFVLRLPLLLVRRLRGLPPFDARG
jgi:hypothetical protein